MILMTTKNMMASVLCVVLALAAISCAESEMTYEKALKISADKGEALKSYDVKGKMSIANLVDGNPMMSMDLVVRSAAVFPNRLLNTISGDMTNVNFGTGEESSWFWLDQLGTCYVGEPRELARDIDSGRELTLDETQIYNFFTGLGQFLLPKDLVVTGDVASEALVVNGTEVLCTVFKVADTPVDSDAMAKGIPHEGEKVYWFDPKSGLVIKSSETFSGMNDGSTIQQTKILAIESFKMNKSVPEDVFTYVPGEGVKVVNSFDRLMNPDSMVGETAPEVIFTDMDGNSVPLSSFKGKVVFLDLWATWCGPCRMEMPHIETLFKEYGSRDDIVFLAASSEEKSTITKFVEKQGFTFNILMVKAEDAHMKFKATSIPAGFVIDKDGVIRAHMVGAQNEGQLRAALAKAGFTG